MFISSIEVLNYKSFRKSGLIAFQPGINLIAGVNNSGKTALLEILGQNFEDKPFAGSKDNPQQFSEALITYNLDAGELATYFSNTESLRLPVLLNETDIHGTYTKALAKGMGITLRSHHSSRYDDFTRITINGIDYMIEEGSEIVITRKPDAESYTARKDTLRGSFPVIKAVQNFANRIFFFGGNRFGQYDKEVNHEDKILRSDARNLPNLLYQQFSDNNVKFERFYESLVRRILPSIESIRPRIRGNGITLEIWPKAPSIDGEDIQFPISDCGSGIGQTLAIIYVLVYEKPSVIVIDEPNTFLHPSATRELMRIFRSQNQHQYFISTHAPEIFAEIKPAFYTVLKYADYETTAIQMNYGELRHAFRELGISPFYERTLWVEGESEEIAFPLIINDSQMRIMKIFSTADTIDRKRIKQDVNRMLRIYERLTGVADGDNPLVSQMRILLDGEHLLESDKDIFTLRNEKIVHFLPRKMFENYLLDPEAIAHLLSHLTGSNVDSLAIQKKLETARGSLEWGEWLEKVNGAELLDEIFRDYNCNYSSCKVDQAPWLTNWLSTNRLGYFDELVATIKRCFVLHTDANVNA